ncbi:MAG: cadmium-translocating P-type ATPase [Clostridia bacterium]|nr:cadmium-translocating P-type ATPase [Clostridia bacterium]
MKKDLIRILCGAVLFVPTLFLPSPYGILLAVFTFLLLSYDVLLSAIKNLFGGNVLDENFLMSVAGIGALLIGEYSEAIAVMLFYRIGEAFEHYAVNRSRKSVAALMDIRPDHANVVRDGYTSVVAPFEVAVGETILVKPGERVPLDGTILQGSSSLDVAALTGESLPREVTVGDTVLSGSINQRGLLTLRVDTEFAESTVVKILDMMENASSKKSVPERFITRFAAVYTPIVVGAAVLLGVIPSLLTGEWGVWIERALSFLVVSCPCALVISVPLSFFGGIGAASKAGVLIKGSNTLESLAKLKTVLFDKTGTLTEGAFSVAEICPTEGVAAEEVLRLAAYGESRSTHPIALSICHAYFGETATEVSAEITELAGFGVRAVIENKRVCIGNEKLMQAEQISLPITYAGTTVYVAVDGKYLGAIRLSDREKPSSATALKELRHAGVKKFVMLTGDTREAAVELADRLGISHYEAELLPADKVSITERYLEENRDGTLAFVGDGINDAPVLARADIGIAMGMRGADAAMEAADAVIMDDDLRKVAKAVRIARKTGRIARQNIVFAIGVKVLILLLNGLGYGSMWLAVFADVGISVLAILNAMRAQKI